MSTHIEITCACGCERKKMVRVADIKRGWGKYFSKRCKAREQTRRTGYAGPDQDSYGESGGFLPFNGNKNDLMY